MVQELLANARPRLRLVGHIAGVRGRACATSALFAELPGSRAQGQPTFKL